MGDFPKYIQFVTDQGTVITALATSVSLRKAYSHRNNEKVERCLVDMVSGSGWTYEIDRGQYNEILAMLDDSIGQVFKTERAKA